MPGFGQGRSPSPRDGIVASGVELSSETEGSCSLDRAVGHDEVGWQLHGGQLEPIEELEREHRDWPPGEPFEEGSFGLERPVRRTPGRGQVETAAGIGVWLGRPEPEWTELVVMNPVDGGAMAKRASGEALERGWFVRRLGEIEVDDHGRLTAECAGQLPSCLHHVVYNASS